MVKKPSHATVPPKSHATIEIINCQSTARARYLGCNSVKWEPVSLIFHTNEVHLIRLETILTGALKRPEESPIRSSINFPPWEFPQENQRK